MKAGYFWVKISENSEWRPALWNSSIWIPLGIPHSYATSALWAVGKKIKSPH